MYICVCARVRECELRRAIRHGARSEEAVGDACGAGTVCGTCVERIDQLIGEEAGVDTLAGTTTPNRTKCVQLPYAGRRTSHRVPQ